MDAIVSAAGWREIRDAAASMASQEPILAPYLRATILERPGLAAAISCLLATRLTVPEMDRDLVTALFEETLAEHDALIEVILCDLKAAVDRNPAVQGLIDVFLNHKGFHALEAYRIAHCLWNQNRKALALHLQSRISEVFAVDIHPACSIGRGIFIDHGTGVVIGETTAIADEVSILQGVTLGGTGKDVGDRHPKIERGVLICAGAKILGNIRIGAASKVGAGSVVLNDVPPRTTVVGVPARIVGRPRDESPALEMNVRVDHE
ncbi:MAG: serine O-acetyltransferase [Rhodospirillaceae bacterium]|jgi:serine O-acetyltransferase|nr:serine O-acetyltransferase [Rhodospirillaceae bacterium]